MSDTGNSLNVANKPELIPAYELDAIRYRTDSLIASGRISSHSAKMAVLDCSDLLNHAAAQAIELAAYRALVAQQLAGLLSEYEPFNISGYMGEMEYRIADGKQDERRDFIASLRTAATALGITLPTS